jgi:hypothetical protein
MKKYLVIAACAISFTTSAQSLIDNCLVGPFTITTIANSNDQVLAPRDLEFKPNTDELWVVNKAGNNGGDNVIIYHAGTPSQVTEYRKDSHSSHFMLIPSAFAFSDIGEFATVGENQSSNGGSSTFMGPVLWSSDTNIFARVFQSNWVGGKPLGSHLDMLHQSPMAMGVAHDTLEAYWVFDGFNSNICKYDFVTNHGPGYENHDNGIIYRYTDIDIQREPDVPSHMIKDKSTGWLYIIDTGHKKLIRINTNTGVVVDTLQPPGTAQETLDGYYEVQGVVQEEIDTFPTRPSGIALYKNRLIVGDYDSGEITVYDISGAFPMVLGVIATSQTGMEGLEIGSDGRIWFVNYLTNTVNRIDPAIAATDAAITEITVPEIINGEKEFYNPGFNYCSAAISPVVTLANEGTNSLTTADISFVLDNFIPTTFSWTGMLTSGQSISVTLPSSILPSGKHTISATVTTPNDLNTSNDKKEGAFRSVAPVIDLPYFESLDFTPFPPYGWDYIAYNPNAFIHQNTSTGGFGASTGCFYMDNYSSYEDISGQIDYMMIDLIDLAAASNLTNFEFNVAYARYSTTSNDRLQLMASTDCGHTWTTIYDKAGAILSTAPISTSFFVPLATQWRHETINLLPLTGNAEVMIMFVFTSDFGNNVYVDDLAITDGGVGINENEDASVFNVYPNPASGILNLSYTSKQNEKLNFRLIDPAGRIVFEKEIPAGSGLNSYSIDVSGFAKGIYSAVLNNNGRIERKKVAVQ